jgi:hypothetical protein
LYRFPRHLHRLCAGDGHSRALLDGFPIPSERGHGTIAGYHCWAGLYAKGIGWISIDASEAA